MSCRVHEIESFKAVICADHHGLGVWFWLFRCILNLANLTYHSSVWMLCRKRVTSSLPKAFHPPGRHIGSPFHLPERLHEQLQ